MADVVLKTVWRQPAPDVHADVRAFWERLKILPPGVPVEQRLPEVCVAAYEGKHLVGVATCALEQFDHLRARLAMFRCAVAPSYQRSLLATELGGRTRLVIEDWSRRNPAEQVMGMATVVQGPNLASKARQAIWPVTGLVLAGFTTDGFQFRVSWFQHAEVDAGAVEAPN